MSAEEINFNAFLEAAGKSFGDAQKEIGVPEGMKAGMLIADAELAVKVGMRYEGKPFSSNRFRQHLQRKGTSFPKLFRPSPSGM